MIVTALASRQVKLICQNLEEQILKDLERNGEKDELASLSDVIDAARVIFESDCRALLDIK